MPEPELNKKRAREFAGLIASVLEPLNEKEIFKEKFKNTQRKFIINASNAKFAALIIINNGTLTVESIPNQPKTNLKKKVVGWDGFLSMDTQTFMDVATNRLSIIGIGVRWLTGRVKMRGLRKLMSLLKIFDMVKE